MKGIARSLIDRTRGRSGVAALDTGGHRCWARSSGFVGKYWNLWAFGALPQLFRMRSSPGIDHPLSGQEEQRTVIAIVY